MTILPLYAAPQFAPQVTDWLWQAFGGETLPRQFSGAPPCAPV